MINVETKCGCIWSVLGLRDKKISWVHLATIGCNGLKSLPQIPTPAKGKQCSGPDRSLRVCPVEGCSSNFLNSSQNVAVWHEYKQHICRFLNDRNLPFRLIHLQASKQQTEKVHCREEWPKIHPNVHPETLQEPWPSRNTDVLRRGGTTLSEAPGGGL